MPRFALGQHRAVGYIPTRQTARCAMANVVMGNALDVAHFHRQHRLGALQRLGLGSLRRHTAPSRDLAGSGTTRRCREPSR